MTQWRTGADLDFQYRESKETTRVWNVKVPFEELVNTWLEKNSPDATVRWSFDGGFHEDILSDDEVAITISKVERS
jgi:hypothetical protein